MQVPVILGLYCWLSTTIAALSTTVSQPVIEEFEGTFRTYDYFKLYLTHPTVVSNQTRAPTVFELMQFHENKIVEKLFKKIPIQPSPEAGKEIFRHMDIYNRCFFELTKRFSNDQDLYAHEALTIKRQLGPLALQEDFDEENVKRMYLYNEEEMKQLHSKLNTTRAVWEKMQVFFDKLIVTVDKPLR